MAIHRGRRLPIQFHSPLLLLVDLQKLFIDPASPAFLRSWPEAATRCRELLDEFRKRDLPVVWTRHEQAQAAPLIGRPLLASDPLAQFGEDFRPESGEPIFAKQTYSARRATGLSDLLADHAIVLAGVTTNRCVLATAVDLALDARAAVVAADACAARTRIDHTAALRTLAGGFSYVARASEILERL